MGPQEVFHFADFLTPQECQEVRAKLISLQQQWIQRAPASVPFYTLGTATYLDSKKDDFSEYFIRAKQQNPVLLHNFSQMYTKLLAVISAYTGQPCELALEYAIPGFHIFRYHPAFTQPIAKIHFDLQYAQIPWKYSEIDFEHPLSFTVPIVMPQQGTGMRWWDIRYADYKDLKEAEKEALIAETSMHYLPYEIGKLLLHDGLILHQIAPAQAMQPDDERITLQGHALFCDGAWRLHW